MSTGLARAGEFAYREWFSVREDGQPDDIRDLLEATGLQLAPEIDRLAFGYKVNELVQFSLYDQIRGLRSKPDAERVAYLSARIVEYIELADRLNRDGDSLPTIPKDRQRYFYSLKNEFENVGNSGLRKNTTKWMHDFYLEGLGLYAAAFSQDPVSTYNECTDLRINPTILFFEHILTHVGHEQHRIRSVPTAPSFSNLRLSRCHPLENPS